jgi:hypothetical protein
MSLRFTAREENVTEPPQAVSTCCSEGRPGRCRQTLVQLFRVPKIQWYDCHGHSEATSKNHGSDAINFAFGMGLQFRDQEAKELTLLLVAEGSEDVPVEVPT